MTDSKQSTPLRRIDNFPANVRPGRHLACPSGQTTYDHLAPVDREGDWLSRISELNWHLPALRTTVHIDGILNQPSIRDNVWAVEFALPWKGRNTHV